MLEPLKHILSSQRVILASASPRRREILSTGCPSVTLEVIPSSAEENLDPLLPRYATKPWLYAEDTAQLKADEVWQRLSQCVDNSKVLVIGADTVVTLDDRIYGKPGNNVQDAVDMLKRLSGQTHTVYTGVCLLMGSPGGGQLCEKRLFHEGTHVTFDDLDEDVIREYVNTGEPCDKAGAYGIQARGGTLVKAIQGDYFNVVGFPLHQFCKQVQSIFAAVGAHKQDVT